MSKGTNLQSSSSRWRTFRYVLLFWAGYALLIAAGASGALTGMLPRQWQQILLPRQLVLFGTVTSLGAFALTVLLVRREKIGLQHVGAALRPRSPLKFAVGFLIGLTLVAMNVAIISLVTGVRWVWAPETGLGGTIMVLVGFVAGACAEELGFRGYPLRRLESAFGLWIAQLIVAAAFILYHVSVGWPWVNAVLGAGSGSVLFGMAAIASRGLALPIGLHAAWNFSDWTTGGKGSPGLWKAVPNHGASSHFPGTVSFFAVTALGILAFSLWHCRNLKRESVT